MTDVSREKAMSDIKSKILSFFSFMDRFTGLDITEFHLDHYRVTKNQYICGFRYRFGNKIEVNVVELKDGISTNGGTLLRKIPEQQMYIDIDMLDCTVVDNAFCDLRDSFYKHDKFNVVTIDCYNDGVDGLSQYHGILYVSAGDVYRTAKALKDKFKRTVTKHHKFGKQEEKKETMAEQEEMLCAAIE